MNQHTRTQSMANHKYLVPTSSNRSISNDSAKSQSVSTLSTNSDQEGSPEDSGKGHQQQLTFLDNISEQTEDADIDDIVTDEETPDGDGVTPLQQSD